MTRVEEPAPLAPPPAAAPEALVPRANSYVETWIPLIRWSRENGYGPVRQVSSASPPAFSLQAAHGILIIRPRSQVASWDGFDLHLGFEPQLINEQPFVHYLDVQKNLEPLLQAAATPPRTNGIIVLDPGHGGQNTGTMSVVDGVCEKEFTLDWALRAADLLRTNGWQVYLTRTNDVDVALSNRVAFAEKHHADLFLSLHFNSAAPSQEQSGVETYCLTPAGMPSNLTRGYDDDVSQVYANNAFDSDNLRYAFRLHRALVQVAGGDRGMRHARFLGVLKGQRCPAVLLEAGYLSNPREARRIADPAYRQELAEALASALDGEVGGWKMENGNRLTEGNGTRRP